MITIKQILVALVLVIGLSGLSNADAWEIHDYDMSGDGTLNYPNEGWITHTAYDGYTHGSIKAFHQYSYLHPSNQAFTLYISGHGDLNIIVGSSAYEHTNHIQYYIGSTPYLIQPDEYTTANSYSGCINGTASPSSTKYCVFEVLVNSALNTELLAHQTVYVSPNIINYYNISGSIECLDNVTLYTEINNTWQYLVENTSNFYLFEIIDNLNYKLIFSDGHEYEFTVDGSDIEYNHDGCSHTQYRFEESCGNLIPDSEGYYSETIGGLYGVSTWFYAPSGILDISNSSTTSFDVFVNTFAGFYGWRVDPVVSNTTYILENPNIAWGLKVIVQDEWNGTLIDGAAVMVNQTCYCTSGYSTRNKRTVNGMVQYGDMSLQDAALFVMKTGYKILDENTTGYNVFLSGRSNFSSKTWVVKLANTSSNNSSTFDEVANKVDIHFRDVSGNLTSKILDTDAYVDLYYQNDNTEEEAMTLRFESSSTHTYFMPERTYTIPHDESGYKRITNGYFTPWDYSYRAVIYNSSIYGWNITIPLTVRNGTREDEQHYQNLTTNLWFMYANDGKVDYRDNLKVAIHARSNNTTLMTTDIELWIDGVYSGCKNLTATDYASADFPYYYVWEPAYNYASGSNYSVRMYGFDRTLLETDYVECITDDTTRKNKLTIIVKDRAGSNLNNCYIYLEGWGSLSTGSTYYNAYEGIDNGDYRYKACKVGYSGDGWEEVTLNDKDKIVTYILTEDYTNTSSTARKFTDDDIKGFFFPLMFFLLICIVLGGLKYVAS